MRTAFKSIVLTAAAIICYVTSVSAQKVSMAIVDQHDAAQTANYKLIMAGLAIVYAVYLVLHNRRRREISRFMGM
jgi:hypothetical protein